ncbi:MAG: hypothetical protein FWG49_05550 [Leptospirales bacterium]|nr:hypothetical protein [Leptospirales bacterium]
MGIIKKIISWGGFETRPYISARAKSLVRNRLLLLILIYLFILGCSKDDGIRFCEGVDNDGTGVSCGKKFTTGDITGVINLKKPFEAEDLVLEIIRSEKNSKITDKTIKLKVERDKKKTNATLPFYNSGNYKVELFKEDDLLAEGSIEIIDTL